MAQVFDRGERNRSGRDNKTTADEDTLAPDDDAATRRTEESLFLDGQKEEEAEDEEVPPDKDEEEPTWDAFDTFEALCRAFAGRTDVVAFRLADEKWRALAVPMEGPEHSCMSGFLKEQWFLWKQENVSFVESLRRKGLFVGAMGTWRVHGVVVFEKDVSNFPDYEGETLTLATTDGRALGTYAVSEESHTVMDASYAIYDNAGVLTHVLGGVEVEVAHRPDWQAVGQGFSLLRSFDHKMRVFVTFVFDVPTGKVAGKFKLQAYECRRHSNGTFGVRVVDFGTVPWLDQRNADTKQKTLALWRLNGVAQLDGVNLLPDGATLATATDFEITNRVLDNDPDRTIQDALDTALANRAFEAPVDLEVPFSFTVDADSLSVQETPVQPTPLTIPVYSLIHLFSPKIPR